MRWVLIIVGAVVVLVLLVVLIGLMLPKAHHASRMARFNQPPEAIFAAIIGPQDWRGVVKTDLGNIDGRRTWREQSKHGTITFEEVASDPPKLYRSRIADKNLPFSGSWTWEIVSTPDGCTCRITEDGEVTNPIFRFVSQLIIGHTRTIEDYLKALGNKFNETTQIEP